MLTPVRCRGPGLWRGIEPAGALRRQFPNLEFVLVLSSKTGVMALERAKKASVPTAVVDRKSAVSEDAFQSDVLKTLRQAKPDVICLAGSVRKLSPAIIHEFRGRILNVHPALLPNSEGQGCMATLYTKR